MGLIEVPLQPSSPSVSGTRCMDNVSRLRRFKSSRRPIGRFGPSRTGPRWSGVDCMAP